MLVRYEVEAYLKPEAGDDGNDVEPLPSASGASESHGSWLPETSFGLTVIKDGSQSMVPQSDVIEIKTRAAHKKLEWGTFYPGLYLSQTSSLYLARHTKGEFQPAEKYALKGTSFATYKEQTEMSLWNLQVLLTQILVAVKKELEGTPLSLVCEGGRLSLYRRNRGVGTMVNNEIKALFKAPGFIHEFLPSGRRGGEQV